MRYKHSKNYLAHANFQYIDKIWKNGRWNYIYPDDELNKAQSGENVTKAVKDIGSGISNFAQQRLARNRLEVGRRRRAGEEEFRNKETAKAIKELDNTRDARMKKLYKKNKEKRRANEEKKAKRYGYDSYAAYKVDQYKLKGKKMVNNMLNKYVRDDKHQVNTSGYNYEREYWQQRSQENAKKRLEQRRRDAVKEDRARQREARRKRWEVTKLNITRPFRMRN